MSLLSDNDIEASSGFVVDLLKERIVFLENELKQKDTVIKFLTKNLVEDNCEVVSKYINANVSLVQSNDSEESSDDCKMIKNSCNGANEHFKKEKGSRPEVFCKKGVLKNFAKFTGKHLCQSFLLIKLQTLGFSEAASGKLIIVGDY